MQDKENNLTTEQHNRNILLNNIKQVMKPHRYLRDGNSTQKYQNQHCQDSDRKDKTKSLRHLNKSQNSLRKSAPLRDRSASRNSKNGSANKNHVAKRDCHSKPPMSRQPNFSAQSSYNHHESQKDVKDVTKAGQHNNL